MYERDINVYFVLGDFLILTRSALFITLITPIKKKILYIIFYPFLLILVGLCQDGGST